MSKLALLMALAALAVNVNGQTNYKTICQNHTMAIYPLVGPACTPLYTQGMDSAAITAVVNRHNELRRRVAQGKELRGTKGAQPAAANMRALSWDTELATVAQRWANQCTFAHDQCRQVARFAVGQNVYKTMSSVAGGANNWTAVVDAWYNEVALFDVANISPFKFNSSNGHYTQVVWANTYLVGCGYAYYKSSLASEASYPYVKYTVCNYGPAGNYLNDTMYLKGANCSACPAGTTCTNGLCV